MAAAQPSKFTKVSKTLDRVKKAARVENDARETLVTEVRADYDKFLERERRRCYLVGSWILHQIPAWFAASDRQAGFLRWLNADRTRRKSACLFGPEADSDLLTPAKAVAMAAEAGLQGLAGDLRDILDDVAFDSAALVDASIDPDPPSSAATASVSADTTPSAASPAPAESPSSSAVSAAPAPAGESSGTNGGGEGSDSAAA